MALDPEFVAAHVLLARSYVGQCELRYRDCDEVLALGRASGSRALELDPEHAGAWMSRSSLLRHECQTSFARRMKFIRTAGPVCDLQIATSFWSPFLTFSRSSR